MKFSEILTKLGDSAAQSISLITYKNCNPEIYGISAVDQATPGNLSYIEGSATL